jgi:glycosyltransferase involved in cell wall biosynthesis
MGINHEESTLKIQESRKKLYIISTYNITCGIASFTDTLESYLRDKFDVEIGILDQYLLKSTNRNIAEFGDKLIDEICAKASMADVVNLQWEPGLLGANTAQILRRFKKIVSSNKKMIVTVHTVLPLRKGSVLLESLRLLRHRRLIDMVKNLRTRLFVDYERKTYKILKKASDNSENFNLCVHTPREVRFFRDVIKIKNVHAHPLSYIRKGWEEKLANRSQELRAQWEERFGYGKKFVGFFGFLSEYKGITIAIRSMRLLPDDYILLIFGGVHPGLLVEGQEISPYVQRLIDDINCTKNKQMDLFNKVKFLGAPCDFDFAAAIMGCDVNVFPYLEIGQSASGPVSQSIDLLKRTIVSNNDTFKQLDNYFPDRTYKIDIGNYIQLAQMILLAMDDNEPTADGLKFSPKTLSVFYCDVIQNCLND